MFRRRMIPCLSRAPRLVDGTLTIIRGFSNTQIQAKEMANITNQNTRGIQANPRSPRTSNIPPANLSPRNTKSDRPRPRRVFDARSLAAPQAGGQFTNILRSPKTRSTRNGTSARARSSRPATKPTRTRDKKGARRRTSKQSDAEEGDDVQRIEIERAYQELSDGTKRLPSPYSPQSIKVETLSETWPTLPAGSMAHTASVVEKLSLMSGRYPNGYVPPFELGKRLFRGQYVQFLNETERNEALTEAQKLSQQRADQFTQRKGSLVEPEFIGFSPVNAEAQKGLVQTLVGGSYASVQTSQAGKSPVLGEILRQLGNNETYQTPGKNSQFIAKVESLLASSRPVKRT